MKNINKIVFSALALCFFATSAYASRPVWIIGHGLNSGHNHIIKDCLDKGANGAEIDVRTKNASTQYEHWSLGHDLYFSPEECDGVSNWSLKQFFTNEPGLKDPRFCLLWIDVKTQDYLVGLMEYVHKLTPEGTPYSIIYNITDPAKAQNHIDEINRIIRDNECLNFGNRDVSTVQKGSTIAANHHFYTKGYFMISTEPGWGRRAGQVRKAQKLQRQGQFCLRTGMWTCDKAYDGYYWLHNWGKGKPTDFDVVLIYCEGGYHIPILTSTSSLIKMKENYWDVRASQDGLHLATRNEPFIHK